MKQPPPVGSVAFLLLLVSIFPRPAMAYVGPGGGLSAIGVFFAVVAVVIVAIFGFVWYPIKRLMRKWKKPGHRDKDGGME